MHKPLDPLKSVNLPNIPEGHALINLGLLPDVALVPLLKSLKRVGDEANRFRETLNNLGIPDIDEAFHRAVGPDVVNANLAAVAISDEIARRGIDHQKLGDEMIAELKTRIKEGKL